MALMKSLQKVKFPFWLLPIFLLAVGVLTFGLLIPHLGFYWDDWSKTLVNVVYGMKGYADYYAEDRPTSSWTHIVFVTLMGNKPLHWHIFTLILRWLTSLSVYVFLIHLWDDKKIQASFVALVFLLYPVFTQQSIPVTFHQQWLQFFLFFLSLTITILAIKRIRYYWWLTSLSLLLLAVQLSITEYFVGLEFLRPVVIWLILKNQSENLSWKNNLGQTLKQYLPYIAFFIAYVIWRMFFIQLSGDDPYRANTLYNLVSQPIPTLINLLRMISVDTYYILIACWSDVISAGVQPGIPRFTLFSWGIGFIVAFSIILFYFFTRDEQKEHLNDSIGSPKRWLFQAFLLGFFALLFGPIPAWVTGREVVYDFHSNRYAMPAMFGASLLLVVLIESIIHSRTQKIIILAAIMGLSSSFHLRIANDYRWLWKDQSRFYWQLYWRAPVIEPDTAIFMENEPFPNQGLFSTSSAVNLIYPQDPGSPTLDYWVFSIYPRYVHSLPNPKNVSLSPRFRSLMFKGNTTNSLLMSYDPTKGNCWWVLSTDDLYNPYISDTLKQFLPVSNLERIKPVSPQPGYPPEDLFGKAPDKSWCYYFEKADLALQFEDWQQIKTLGNEAAAQGFSPSTSSSNSPREWIPFIKGYTRLGDWQTAYDLTLQSYEMDGKYQEMLCSLWLGLDSNDKSGETYKNNILNHMACEE
jgi:hypothetical protein